MPPTFLVFLGAVFYIPAVLLLLSVGFALLIVPRTRTLGRRIVYATIATVAALAISCAATVAVVLPGVFVASLLAKPWTQNGQVEDALVAAILGFTFLSLLLLGAAFVGASLVVAWRIGWRMASGLSMWKVVEADPLLKRLDPWHRRAGHIR